MRRLPGDHLFGEGRLPDDCLGNSPLQRRPRSVLPEMTTLRAFAAGLTDDPLAVAMCVGLASLGVYLIFGS